MKKLTVNDTPASYNKRSNGPEKNWYMSKINKIQANVHVSGT